MPRWASRITPEIADVRVERVQDISDDDIRAEGIRVPVADGKLCMRLAPSNAAGKVPSSYLLHGRMFPDQPPLTAHEMLIAHFADLWDTINAKRGHPWSANDWVWALTVKRIEP
jgi:hypothetical protein